MIKAKDFSTRRKFPGREGNLFDVLLRKAMVLERIPTAFFLIILILFSLAGFASNEWYCLLIFGFFLFDWISIALLPKFKRSFGPVHPQVFALAICRMIPVIFFGPEIWLPLELFGCVLQIYAFWVEPYIITVSTETLATDKLPAGSHFRILHIGDLHLERFSIREEKLNKLILKIAPDAILFSGDFLCLSSIRDNKSWSDLRDVLSVWKAPLGIFGVTGSPAVDLPENFPKLLESTPINLLDNELVALGKDNQQIDIIGLGCSHIPHEDYAKLQPLLSKANNPYRILLHHSPDIAPLLTDGRIDLQLSGHTHGGQVCLPIIGPLFTGSLYGLKFKSGKYQIGNLMLYIVRGLGLEGLSAPRVRFLCPPEIVVWEITGKS